jgi:hypothetical protein
MLTCVAVSTVIDSGIGPTHRLLVTSNSSSSGLTLAASWRCAFSAASPTATVKPGAESGRDPTYCPDAGYAKPDPVALVLGTEECPLG